jgi:hypothetical protein
LDRAESGRWNDLPLHPLGGSQRGHGGCNLAERSMSTTTPREGLLFPLGVAKLGGASTSRLRRSWKHIGAWRHDHRHADARHDPAIWDGNMNPSPRPSVSSRWSRTLQAASMIALASPRDRATWAPVRVRRIAAADVPLFACLDLTPIAGAADVGCAHRAPDAPSNCPARS